MSGRLRRGTAAGTVFCAELVAATYTAMGLLPADRPRNWYDPGSFWSGDDLRLLQGATLGPEVPVHVPAAGGPTRPAGARALPRPCGQNTSSRAGPVTPPE